MKKILLPFLIVLIFGCIILFNITSNEIVTSNDIIRYETFYSNYKINAIVTCNKIYIDFQGNLVKEICHLGQFAKKNDDLIEYKNYELKNKKLKSTVDGYVLEIDPSYISLGVEPFYLECYLPLRIVEQISIGQKASYIHNGKLHLATVFEISKVGFQQNGNVIYPVKLEIIDDLYLNQQVVIEFKLNGQNGYVVNKNAILEDEKGFFILESDYWNNLKNYNDYRIDIKVLSVNDNDALIDGINLMDKEVCILSSELKEVLIND